MKINEMQGALKDLYIDWSAFLLNPRYARIGWTVAWNGYVPTRLDHPVLKSNVARLVNDGQYTYQVPDGSIFQMLYVFERNGEDIHHARLAFYSARILFGDTRVEGLEFSDPDDVSDFLDGPVAWLRLDFTPSDSCGVLHHDCHMHIAGFPESRVVVDGLPTPNQFVEFVLSLCYPATYKAHRLDDDGQFTDETRMLAVNSHCIPRLTSTLYNHITHLRIP